jgi:hypothetical protein
MRVSLQRQYSIQKGGKKPGFSLSDSLISLMLNLKKPGFYNYCTGALDDCQKLIKLQKPIAMKNLWIGLIIFLLFV